MWEKQKMHFLVFPQCFEKASFPEKSKGVIVWEWVKRCQTGKDTSCSLTCVNDNVVYHLGIQISTEQALKGMNKNFNLKYVVTYQILTLYQTTKFWT